MGNKVETADKKSPKSKETIIDKKAGNKSEYSVSDFQRSGLFDCPDIVAAAFSMAGKKAATVDEAKTMVEAFKKMEV